MEDTTTCIVTGTGIVHAIIVTGVGCLSTVTGYLVKSEDTVGMTSAGTGMFITGEYIRIASGTVASETGETAGTVGMIDETTAGIVEMTAGTVAWIAGMTAGTVEMIVGIAGTTVAIVEIVEMTAKGERGEK